jgi:hypothetical protein
MNVLHPATAQLPQVVYDAHLMSRLDQDIYDV